MKLLHIWNTVSFPAAGGSGSQSHNTFLKRAFSNLGHEVVPFALGSGSGAPDAGMQKHRAAYHRLRRVLPATVTEWVRDLYSVLYDFRSRKAIGALIAQEQPDFVYERFSDYHAGGWQAARAAHLPYVLEIHDPPEARAFFARRANFEWYNRRLQRRITRDADAVVVVSSFLQKFLEKGGVPTENILMLPNGVNLELFRKTGRRDELRRKLGVEDALVVGFVGSMRSYHGADMIAPLCRLIEQERRDVRYLMVGSLRAYPGGEEAYRDLLRQAGIEDRVVITGGLPVEQVPSHIEAMDICIMPDSNHYGSPIKLFEYGALAKPCVFPRYGPVEDVLTHEVNALIFEPKSVEALAAEVLKLAQSESLREQLGERLYQDVIANHTWERNAASIIDKVEQVREQQEAGRAESTGKTHDAP